MRYGPRILPALLLLVPACSSNAPEREGGSLSGVQLQQVTFAGLQQNLASLKGRVVLLSFWASY